MSASQNISRISERVDHLEDLYETYRGTYDLGVEDLDNSPFFKGISNAARSQILRKLLNEGYTVRDLDLTVTSSDEFTFNDTMDEIGNILTSLSGFQGLDDEVTENLVNQGSNFKYYDLPLMQSRKNGRFLFDIVVQPFTSWLEDVISKFEKMESKSEKRFRRNDDDNDDLMALTETMKRTKFT